MDFRFSGNNENIECALHLIWHVDTIVNTLTNLSHDMTKRTKWVCIQRRLRSEWAPAQSDQSLRCALSVYLSTQAFFMQTAKTEIKLGWRPGWSESSLGAQPFCWFCHVAVHLFPPHSQWKRLEVCGKNVVVNANCERSELLPAEVTFAQMMLSAATFCGDKCKSVL